MSFAKILLTWVLTVASLTTRDLAVDYFTPWMDKAFMIGVGAIMLFLPATTLLGTILIKNRAERLSIKLRRGVADVVTSVNAPPLFGFSSRLSGCRFFDVPSWPETGQCG